MDIDCECKGLWRREDEPGVLQLAQTVRCNDTSEKRGYSARDYENGGRKKDERMEGDENEREVMLFKARWGGLGRCFLVFFGWGWIGRLSQ